MRAIAVSTVIAICGIAQVWPAVARSQDAPRVLVFDYPAPTTQISLEPAPDLNTSPIHVWFYRETAAGPFTRVRALGHANAAVCQQASEVLLDLQTATGDASSHGFLGFGVADISIDSSNQVEQHAASDALRRISQIADASPEWVQLHEVVGAVVDALSTVLPAQRPGSVEVVGVYGNLLIERGPAFVPLRTFDAGNVVPVTFTMGAAELAPGRADRRFLTGTGLIAVLSENRRALRGQIATLRDFQNLQRQSHGLGAFRDLSAYESGPVADLRQDRSSIQAALQSAQSNIQRLTSLRDFFVAYATAEEVVPAGVRQEARELASRMTAAIERCTRHNERVLAYRARGQRVDVCHISFIYGGGPVGEMLDAALAISADTLNRRLRQLEVQLQRINRAIASRTAQSSAWQRVAGAEALVDALLRGWPIPVQNRPEGARVDRMLQRVPAVISRALASIERSRGAELNSAEGIRGLLSRSTVFFMVQQQPDGNYQVTPMYAVVGPYVELFDPVAHTITVEDPRSGATAAYLAEQQGGVP